MIDGGKFLVFFIVHLLGPVEVRLLLPLVVSLLDTPTFIFISYWFVTRKGELPNEGM